MSRRVLFLLATLTLSGCGGSIKNPGVELDYVPETSLPRYSIGDLFVYDDGYVERVTHVDGEIVSWETAGGRLHYTAYRNFILPRLSWENEESKGSVRMNVKPDMLWPLRPGEGARITDEHTITIKLSNWSKPFNQEWRCKVGDPERLEVPAGVFDTIPVSCMRNGFLSGKWWQTRIWYYAPALGHYVRKIDEAAPSKFRRYTYTQRDLTVFIPAIGGLTQEEQLDVERHFQESLEKLSSGMSSEWHNADDTSGRKILIRGSFATQDGRLCREFDAEVRSQGQIRAHAAAACREAGAWRYALARDSLQMPPATMEGIKNP